MTILIHYLPILALVSYSIAAASAATVGCGRQAPGLEPKDVTATSGRATRENKHSKIDNAVFIVGGDEAKPHSWPWAVVVYGRGECSGSLLRVKDGLEASDIVLTAAHCVTEEKTRNTKPQLVPANVFSIRLGVHDKTKDVSNKEKAVEVRMYPAFKRLHNDIALIKLAKPVGFTDQIRPVCLPTQNEPLPLNRKCVAAGWGKFAGHADKDTSSPLLRQIAYPVLKDEDCASVRRSGGLKYNKTEMLCAGSLKSDKGTASGDSGGMLVCQSSDGKWVQYGVNSFGVEPDIFARVSSYVGWINENIQKMTSAGH